MNDVALCANDVLCNDVMLRINDVALRANGHAFAARRSVGERLGAPVFNEHFGFFGRSKPLLYG